MVFSYASLASESSCAHLAILNYTILSARNWRITCVNFFVSQVDTKRFAAFTKTYPNQAVHSEDTPADTDWKIIHVNHNFLMSLRSHFYLKSTSLERCLCLIIRKNNDISQNCDAVTMAISLLNSQYFCHKISVNSVLSDMTEVTLGRFFFVIQTRSRAICVTHAKKPRNGFWNTPYYLNCDMSAGTLSRAETNIPCCMTKCN